MSALARGKSTLNKQVVIGNQLLKPAVHSKVVPKRLSHIGVSLPDGVQNVKISSFPSFGPQYSTKLLTDQLVANLLQERAFSSESVLFPHEVDISSISLGPPKKGKAGQLYVPIEYAGRKLRIQSPAVRTPFGASRFKTDKGEEMGSLAVQLSLEQANNNPKVKALIDFVNKVDDIVLNHAKKNAKLWFPGKNYLPDYVAGLFIKSLRSSKDFAPSLRLKIDTPKGEPAVNVYLHDEPAPVEALTSNSTIVAIFEPRSVYMIWNGGFGITWAVRQVKIVNRPTYTLDPNAFREDAPDLQNVAPKPKSPNPRPPIAEEASLSQREEVDAVLDERSAADEIIEGDEEVNEELEEEEPVPVKAVRPPTKQAPVKAPVKAPVQAPKVGFKAATVPIKQVPVKAVPSKVPVKAAAPTKPVVAPPKVAVAPAKATIAPKKK